MPATVERFFNASSSPGGDGTTTATSGASRAYSSIDEALDQQLLVRADLVTADEQLVLTGPGFAGPVETAYAEIGAGWTMDATRNVIVRQAKIEFARDGALIRIDGQPAILRDLWAHNTRTTGDGSGFSFHKISGPQVGAVAIAERCFAQGNANAALDQAFGFVVDGDIEAWIRNCYAWDCLASATDWGVGFYSGSNYHIRAFQCGAIDCLTGFRKNAIAWRLSAKNSGAAGCTQGYLGTFHTDSTNNASNAADAPGANPRNSVSPTFVNAAADNFRLDAGDTAWQGQGANLTTDADWPTTTDIDGTTRTVPFDIGPHEVSVGGGGGGGITKRRFLLIEA